MPRIEFSPPDINEEDIAAVAEVLRSGWITTGPVTKAFEQSLARWCETEYVACLNSATAAMECALRVLGIGPGDEVVTSAYTYTASASVISHVGATVVLADVAAGSYHIDPEALAGVLSPRTKAVISVDIAGLMCDYEQLFSVLERCRGRCSWPAGSLADQLGRLPVIADAAHSLGATYHGQASGSVADLTAFSFHAVKNLTTGEGGALTWRRGVAQMLDLTDDSLYKQLMLLSLHGQSKDALAKSGGGSWEYDVVAPWYKCNMPDITAALGQSQLKRYAQTLERRQELIGLYRSQLLTDARSQGYELDILAHRIDDVEGGTSASSGGVSDKVGATISSGHLMLVRLLGRGENFRNQFIEEMAQRDVVCNVHFKPLPLLSAYRKLGHSIEDYPRAFAQYQNEVTLPLYTGLSNSDVVYVCDCFRESYAACLERCS